jgi:plastocyanin
MGEIKGGIWNIMERLDWRNCKNIEFVGDIKANYDFIIELEDMPFEKGQRIAFDSEGGITYGCIVDRVRGMKIFLIVEEEE